MSNNPEPKAKLLLWPGSFSTSYIFRGGKGGKSWERWERIKHSPGANRERRRQRQRQRQRQPRNGYVGSRCRSPSLLTSLMKPLTSKAVDEALCSTLSEFFFAPLKSKKLFLRRKEERRKEGPRAVQIEEPRPGRRSPPRRRQRQRRSKGR